MQVSYNIMMEVYARAGLFSEVEKLFQAMLIDGCSPNSVTYLYHVQAYALSLKYEEAEKTIISMQKKGIPVYCAHFNILLSAFAKAGMMAEAERVYNKLLRDGLSPDLACIRSMLRGYMNCGCIEDGISFYEQIKEFAELDRFIMSVAVHFYRTVGKEPEAAGLLKFMNSSGIQFLKNLEIGPKVKAS